MLERAQDCYVTTADRVFAKCAGRISSTMEASITDADIVALDIGTAS